MSECLLVCLMPDGVISIWLKICEYNWLCLSQICILISLGTWLNKSVVFCGGEVSIKKHS